MEGSEYPLISSICIPNGKPESLAKSISCFLTQSYPNKELIIVCEERDMARKKTIDSFDNSQILAYPINSKRDDCMDIFFAHAMEKANGSYICLWSEKDWSHMARMEYQYQALIIKNVPSCLLNYIMTFDERDSKAYISPKRIWKESFFCFKDVLENLHYSDLEDQLDKMFPDTTKLYLVSDVPNLYIHIQNKGKCEVNNDPWAEIIKYSYELSLVDAEAISTMLQQPKAKKEDSLAIDMLLNNPLFEEGEETLFQTNVIPKIIHVTYKEKIIPEKYTKTFDSIRRFHPEWEIKIHDDEDAEKLVKNSFPELWTIYSSYPCNIQRVDLFRVLVVYLEGGFYLDMDMHCFKSLNELCGESLVLGEEIVYHNDSSDRLLDFEGDTQIGNYMFGSIPGHPFWLDLVLEMINRCDMSIKYETDVLKSTGPGVLSDVYYAARNKYDDIKLVKNKYKRCHTGCPAVSCHFGDFAAHLHVNSWTWSKKKLSQPPKISPIEITDKIKNEAYLTIRDKFHSKTLGI